MTTPPMYCGPGTFLTLTDEHMTEYLIQAQWAEMVELKRVIHNLAKNLGRKLRVLDIGIGNARVPGRLSGIREIWDIIQSYDGIDNSPKVLEKARAKVSQSGLESIVSLRMLDAKSLAELQKLQKNYDLAIATYFTAGNFCPDGFQFETDKTGKLKQSVDLQSNPAFDKIFRAAYDLLTPGGQLFLGSVYLDNDSTREKQEEFYRKCGMTVITRPTDSFTATKEGFWSQRFTPERICSYFGWVQPENIEIKPLDTYRFAMMAIVSKTKG